MAISGKNIPWARLGFESVLIVVSILLAFAIERWWSDRQDSIEEQTLLRQLKVEFENNASRLAEKRLQHEEVRSAGLRLLSLTSPEATVDELGIEAIQADLGTLMSLFTYDPGTGALSVVIQSKLDLISSVDLRTSLSAWPANYQDLAEDEQWIIEVTLERVHPYLVESTTIQDFSTTLTGVRKGRFPADLEIMLRDRKFGNILTAKIGRIASTLNEYDETELLFNETLALIQSQIH